jgi:1,2-phenylacetyl-CoA epoxidase catalytic subunit
MDRTTTALSAEYDRTVRRMLERGQTPPERGPDDVLVGTYDPRVLRAVAGTWRMRMRQEHHSSAVFAGLLPQAMEAGAPVDVKMALLRASMDELRHAALCAEVAELLGASAEVEQEMEPAAPATHEDIPAEEVFLRNVFFVGCLSETVAVALLTDERDACEEPWIRRVLTQLMGDETLHARVGWLWLHTLWPTLDAAARRRMDEYLPLAFGYYERCMVDATSGGRLRGEQLRQARQIGFADSTVSRQLFYETMEAVVVPRLQEIGLDAVQAWSNRDAAGATDAGQVTLTGGSL